MGKDPEGMGGKEFKHRSNKSLDKDKILNRPGHTLVEQNEGNSESVKVHLFYPMSSPTVHKNTPTHHPTHTNLVHLLHEAF